MALETKSTLNQSTIEGLQKLIRYNLDSVEGFKHAADQIDEPKVETVFREIANERSQFADQLQQFVDFNFEEPVKEGSAMAALHRTWLNVRSALNGGDVYPVLAEAERGEDYIKAAYENTLKETAGSAMNDVLQTQYASVKAAHDKVRDMRDCWKEKADCEEKCSS